MSGEVIYVPERSNTHYVQVEKWTTDWRESYWQPLQTFADTEDGRNEAKAFADAEAEKGHRVQVVRKAKFGI